MNRDPPVHPGQRRDGELELARNDFAAIFKGINYNVHPRRSIRSESNFVRFSIDELGDLLSNGFPFCEPTVPMHIAVTHHRFVVTRCRFVRSSRHWSGGGGVEIRDAFGY